MQKGIDVWEGNGNINWDNVDTDFAILRLGYIGNNENKKDSKFEQNYNECKSRGIPVGVYVYDYAKSIDRVEQCARWVVDELQGKIFELPVYIDMEQESITYLGKDYLTSICIAFNTIIEQNGYKAGVYANRNWFDNYLNEDALKEKYNCWIAHYGVNLDKYEGEYDLLQYSEHGKVNGISGDVDLNVMYSDVPRPTPQPTPEPKYTYEQFIWDLQGAIGARQDSIAGPETLSKTPTISKSKNRKNAAVRPVQKYLYALGYTEVGEADCIAGDKFDSAVKRYQRDHGCVVDGEITAKCKTWKKLLKLI